MARFKDPSFVRAAFEPYLQPGEQVRHVANAVRQPPIWLIVLLLLIGILPGVIAIAVMTKEYVVAVTDRRFIVLQFSGSKIRVQEERSWPLGAMPPVKVSTGGLFTHIRVEDPAKPFMAKIHRMGMPNQRDEALAIEGALTAG